MEKDSFYLRNNGKEMILNFYQINKLIHINIFLTNNHNTLQPPHGYKYLPERVSRLFSGAIIFSF